MASTAPAKTLRLLSKKKYALLLGYSGAGYSGMQINPGVKTIEGEVIDALHKLGAITDAMVSKLSQCGWMRAARTDKGVHSLGNVISVKLRLPESPESPAPPPVTPEKLTELKADKELQAKFDMERNEQLKVAADSAKTVFLKNLNEILPDQIRVYDCIRVTRGFHSKNLCTGRKYEYLLPTYTLAKQSQLWAIAAKIAEENAEALDSQGDTREWNQHLLEEMVTKSIEANPSISSEDKKSLLCPPTADEDAEDLARQWRLAERKKRMESFRIDDETRQRLTDALQCYVGTHKYHNFTSGLNPSDMQAQRFITSFTCSEPIMLEGMEFVRLRVEGQSFVLNQIRKMVGMAVEVVRRGEDVNTLKLAFESRQMDVPMAPACGLVLRSCVFKTYNADYGKGGSKSDGEPIDFEMTGLVEKVDEFAQSVVYPTMLRDELDKAEFLSWSHHWDKRKFPARGQELAGRGKGKKAQRQDVYKKNQAKYAKGKRVKYSGPLASELEASDLAEQEVVDFLMGQ